MERSAFSTATVSATELARQTAAVRELVAAGPVLITRRGRIIAVLSPTSHATLAQDVGEEDLNDESLFVPLRELSRTGPAEALAWVASGRRKVLTAHNRPIAVISPSDGTNGLREVLDEAFADVDVDAFGDGSEEAEQAGYQEPPSALAETSE